MKFLSTKTLMALLLALAIPIKAQEQTLSEAQAVAADISQQIVCMAKNIYYEAATESYEGKLAVAQVTMNRVNHHDFPKTVCGVVYQKVNNTYQFSLVGMSVDRVKNQYAWEESMIVARKALTEQKLHDTLYRTKSLNYHNTSVSPEWKLKRVAKIGNHIFYSR
jgi:spore germination cell wall hydrolase CwlJ-like protein